MPNNRDKNIAAMPPATTSISVILPNYNHAHWLPCALSALLRQDPLPAEVIVVDDASTDDSIAVIERIRHQHPIVQLIRHETNKGVAAAVDSALQRARGDFLFFAAADDFVLPGLFARAAQAFSDCREAAFFCSEVVQIDESNRIVGFRPSMIPQSQPGYVPPNEVRRRMHHSDNWFVGTSTVYRHTKLAEIGYFDQGLITLQDAMATRLLAFRHGFYFAPEVLAAWRVIPASLSARSSLSPANNEKLLAKARTWITTRFPDDVKTEYAEIFDRRLRFNFARARLVWGAVHDNVDSIADVLQWKSFDRAILRALSRMPVFSSQLALFWMALRVRPYGTTAIAAFLWRSVTLNRTRRAALARAIDAAQSPTSTGISG
jgi:glycosyltransferase involved in cell wall biosynthesis